MAVIKEGFNSRPLHIRVSVYEGTANVTVEQEGLKTEAGERVLQRYETLSYASIEELIALRDEINRALTAMVGL